MLIRMKRRYLRQNFHPSFGYYIGFSIVRVQETRELRNVAPNLVSESQITDLPLAWNKEDAKEFFKRKEEFAFLARATDGRVLAGVMEKDDYERRKDKEPNFDAIIDAWLYVKEHKL